MDLLYKRQQPDNQEIKGDVIVSSCLLLHSMCYGRQEAKNLPLKSAIYVGFKHQYVLNLMVYHVKCAIVFLFFVQKKWKSCF